MTDWTPCNIRKLLRRLGWSQERLARHIGACTATVNRWANGAHPVTDRYLRARLDRLAKRRP